MKTRIAVLWLAALLTATAAASITWAQEGGEEGASAPAQGEREEAGEQEEVPPPSAWAAGERPDPITRIFDAKRKKVFRSLLKVLEEMNIPVEIADPETGLINTKLIEFDHQRRWGNLATKPVDISRERPILQRQGLNNGKFSVQATLSDAGRKTEIVISTYLEEHAKHYDYAKRIWVERYSNGKLENLILDKLQERLD